MNNISYSGSGELYIGAIRDARELCKSHIDAVITVCQENVSDNISSQKEYHFFCMSDGPNNSYGGDSSYELFEQASNTLYQLLQDEQRVLIHCHKGQSRSVSVSIAALARITGRNRSDAYDLVERYRPQANPDTHLMSHASTYINKNS